MLTDRNRSSNLNITLNITTSYVNDKNNEQDNKTDNNQYQNINKQKLRGSTWAQDLEQVNEPFVNELESNSPILVEFHQNMQIKSGLDAINLRNLLKSSELRYGVLIPRCLIMLINVVTAEENGKKRLQTQSKSENQSVLKRKISFGQKSFEAFENKVMVAFTTKTEQPKVQPQQRRQSRMSIGIKNHQNSVLSINGPKKRMSIFQQIHPYQRTFIYNLFPWMRNMRQKFYQQYYYLDIQVKNYLLEMYQVA
ncbi:MAG: hypothetical protein EZS28_048317, partial [Streblomastix strix]